MRLWRIALVDWDGTVVAVRAMAALHPILEVREKDGASGEFGSQDRGLGHPAPGMFANSAIARLRSDR